MDIVRVMARFGPMVLFFYLKGKSKYVYFIKKMQYVRFVDLE